MCGRAAAALEKHKCQTGKLCEKPEKAENVLYSAEKKCYDITVQNKYRQTFINTPEGGNSQWQEK